MNDADPEHPPRRTSLRPASPNGSAKSLTDARPAVEGAAGLPVPPRAPPPGVRPRVWQARRGAHHLNPLVSRTPSSLVDSAGARYATAVSTCRVTPAAPPLSICQCSLYQSYDWGRGSCRAAMPDIRRPVCSRPSVGDPLMIQSACVCIRRSVLD